MVNWNQDFVFCGGTIISNKFVMTAAHCTADRSPSDINVKVGEHDLTTSNDNAKVYKVKEIYNHPNYDKQRYVTEIKNHTILMLNLITIVLSFFSTDMDFSILELEEELTFSNWVRPACLPKTNESTYEGVDGKICNLNHCIRNCENY